MRAHLTRSSLHLVALRLHSAALLRVASLGSLTLRTPVFRLDQRCCYPSLQHDDRSWTSDPMTAARSSMHWFVPPPIDIRSETNEQWREPRRCVRPRPPPALLLSPSSSGAAAAGVAAISVFTPVAAASARAFSPRLDERPSSSKKQTSRFAFVAPAAHAAAASPSGSAPAATSAPPDTGSCLSPFKMLLSPMHSPATPVAVMHLCAPPVSPCWQQHAQHLSPDQQALRNFLLSPSCSLLRRGHCRSSSASAATLDPLPEPQLQRMLQACTLTADTSSPLPLTLSLSHLRYLESLHLVFHSAAEIVDTLQDLTLQSRHVVQELKQLLQESCCVSSSSSVDAAAWTILLHSGAGVDSPFFLRLLLSERTSSAAPFSVSPLPSLSLSSELDAVVSLLQSFVKHYTQETREPLVSFLQQQRCDWNHQQQHSPQFHRADLTNSAPMHLSDDESPASAAHFPPLPSPQSRFSPTSLVHRLFMRLGPAHVHQLHGVIATIVAGGAKAWQSPAPQPQPQLLGAHTHGLSSFAADVIRSKPKLAERGDGCEGASLNWTQLAAAAEQCCLRLASSCAAASN